MSFIKRLLLTLICGAVTCLIVPPVSLPTEDPWVQTKSSSRSPPRVAPFITHPTSTQPREAATAGPEASFDAAADMLRGCIQWGFSWYQFRSDQSTTVDRRVRSFVWTEPEPDLRERSEGSQALSLSHLVDETGHIAALQVMSTRRLVSRWPAVRLVLSTGQVEVNTPVILTCKLSQNEQSSRRGTIGHHIYFGSRGGTETGLVRGDSLLTLLRAVFDPVAFAVWVEDALDDILSQYILGMAALITDRRSGNRNPKVEAGLAEYDERLALRRLDRYAVRRSVRECLAQIHEAFPFWICQGALEKMASLPILARVQQ